MRNFGGAAIHMRREIEATDFFENTGKITYILGNKKSFVQMKEEKPYVPFSDAAMQFLGALSDRLLNHREIRVFPEAAAFAFWCRTAHLKQMKAEYVFPEVRRLGRGVSLHFAPSNMPVLFAFSLAAGLLAGNSVILRLSRKETRQEQIIVHEIEALQEEQFIMFKNRIILCRYEHDREITDALSALCDVRILWGSDETVAELRKSPLPSRAVDLPFASRGSLAILSAEEVLLTKEMDLLARRFYNDTYLNDQNACSSPRMIYWIGEKEAVKAAKERFWNAVCSLLDAKRYQVSAVIAVQKLDHALTMAAIFENTEICRENNQLVRVQVTGFQREMWNHMAPGGFFVECEGETLDGVEAALTSYCQTICTYGVDHKELADELIRRRVSGADRIVSVGQALDFSLTWDGFDLIEAMSRRIHRGCE